jgi:hypothetical protein
MKYLQNLQQLRYSKTYIESKREYLVDKLKTKYEVYKQNHASSETEYNKNYSYSNPLFHDEQDDNEGIQNEIESYLYSPPDKYINPFTWWKENSNSFPILAKMSLRYLVIPCTASFIERTWSLCAPMFRENRKSLSNNLIESMLYFKKFLNE